ncbi:hypothetical protein AVEN_115609-1 [Araneus ventricosus]|uniref:Uncharacterized protein n=1 Tax=Araneus ventricosus TaxID=182803 RepID=A0A4Y2NB48_ARAVE|nr:hypothetical protein AVEN_115609-1 [Araneus ventricosus]
MAVAHRTASAAEIRAPVGTTLTQRTVTNRLLQRQLRARRPVVSIPLTPNHVCHVSGVKLELIGGRSGDLLYFLVKDGSALVPVMDVCWLEGGQVQPTCLRPRHTGPTPGVMIWGAISYDRRSTLWLYQEHSRLVIQPVVLPFMNSIQGVFSNRIALSLIPLL